MYSGWIHCEPRQIQLRENWIQPFPKPTLLHMCTFFCERIRFFLSKYHIAMHFLDMSIHFLYSFVFHDIAVIFSHVKELLILGRIFFMMWVFSVLFSDLYMKIFNTSGHIQLRSVYFIYKNCIYEVVFQRIPYGNYPYTNYCETANFNIDHTRTSIRNCVNFI